MENLEERREQLRAAIAEEWEYELSESPEFATMIGDYRYNDRWSDLSLAHVEEQKRDLTEWLARFEAIDTSGFPEQEILDHRLMVRNLRESLEDLDFQAFEMPVDQMDGLHLMLAQFVSLMPFDTTGTTRTTSPGCVPSPRTGADDRTHAPGREGRPHAAPLSAGEDRRTVPRHGRARRGRPACSAGRSSRCPPPSARPIRSVCAPRSSSRSTSRCGRPMEADGLHRRRVRAQGADRDGHLVAARRGAAATASP